MPVYQVTRTITTTDAIYIPQDAKSIIATNSPIKTKKLDNDLLDALEESYISFQDFLEEAHNTHVTKRKRIDSSTSLNITSAITIPPMIALTSLQHSQLTMKNKTKKTSPFLKSHNVYVVSQKSNVTSSSYS